MACRLCPVRSDLELFRKVLNENQPLGVTNQLCHGVIRSLFSAQKATHVVGKPSKYDP